MMNQMSKTIRMFLKQFVCSLLSKWYHTEQILKIHGICRFDFFVVIALQLLSPSLLALLHPVKHSDDQTTILACELRRYLLAWSICLRICSDLPVASRLLVAAFLLDLGGRRRESARLPDLLGALMTELVEQLLVTKCMRSTCPFVLRHHLS
jgi:hypothetical protein